jgi:hypothetical protein
MNRLGAAQNASLVLLRRRDAATWSQVVGTLTYYAIVRWPCLDYTEDNPATKAPYALKFEAGHICTGTAQTENGSRPNPPFSGGATG